MADHSQNTKRVAKNTLYMYFRMILVMLVSIYTSRVKLQYLGIENVGIYNVVGSFVVMFTFLNGSIQGATQRFLTFAIGENNQEKITRVFSTSINMHGLIGLLVFVLGETIGLWFVNYKMVVPEGSMFATNIVYQLSLFTTMVSVMNVPYSAAIVAYERMSIYAYLSILSVVLNLVIIFTLPYITIDILIAYAIMVALISLLMQVIYVAYCRKKFPPIRYHFVIDKALCKEMAGFIGWLTCGNFAFMLNHQGINVLLNLFFGPVINAARSIAEQVQGAVKQFVTGFMQAAQPQIVKSYASNDLSYMHSLLILASKVSFLLMLLLSLPVILEADFILNLWLVEVPEYTKAFLCVILFQSLSEALSLPLIMSINATAQIKKFQIFETSFMLLAVPVSYIILKLGGNPVSVYIVCLLDELGALCVRIWLTLPKIQMSYTYYIKTIMLRLWPVLLICFGFCYFIKHLMVNEWVQFFVTCSASCIVVLTVSYIIGLNASERVIVRAKVHEFYKNKIARK